VKVDANCMANSSCIGSRGRIANGFLDIDGKFFYGPRAYSSLFLESAGALISCRMSSEITSGFVV
jgi:hypothetical protein